VVSIQILSSVLILPILRLMRLLHDLRPCGFCPPKRTLLDPRLNVAEVAERCGFCNAAYLRPREFARRPEFLVAAQTS
jgi:AraC-like DNA-binding protein